MNILLIRLRLIGDVVFTTPAIRAIKAHLPQARLTYLVEPLAAPVVAGLPHLDELIVHPRETNGLAGWWSDFQLLRTLRAKRFDVAIDFHGGPRAAWIARLSGAPMRIGYQRKFGKRNWAYTHVVDRPTFDARRHSVENQWALLAPLGGRLSDPPDPGRDAAQMAPNADAVASVARWRTEHGVERTDPLIVVHVSAGNLFRRWPESAFADLAAGLVMGDRRRRVMLTSGPSDADAARRVAAAATERIGTAGAVIAPPEFDLHQLRAFVDGAALFIGGDSGPLHIASTTGTPIVAIFGPTLPVRSMPWRDPALVTEAVDVGPLPCRPCDQRVCEPGDFRCLNGITAEAVLAAAERALARQAARRPAHPAVTPGTPLRYSVRSG